MKKTKMKCRILSALLAVALCFSCMGSQAAFAAGEDGEPPRIMESADENSTNMESGTGESTAANEGDSQEPRGDDVSADAPREGQTAESVPEAGGNPGKSEVEANYSEAEQTFLSAVAAIDRDAILRTANAWGLAHKAWEGDKENAELKAALDEAVAASDEAAAGLYAAEDLFYEISEEEQSSEAVQATYLSLMSIVTAMHLAMDNPTDPTPTVPAPTEPGTGGDEPPAKPDKDEIAAILYGDLPDAPTGYYMGQYGLPVATGETKISIGAWETDLLFNDRMDAGALNRDSAAMTVPLQAGKEYAIISILTQVEYPAHGSSSTVILPDGVTLLSQDGSGREANAEETERIFNQTYHESSAAVSGFSVRASDDFAVQLVYTAPDGTMLKKELVVHIDKSSARDAALYGLPTGSSTYAGRPAPAVTTGKVTRVEKINGT